MWAIQVTAVPVVARDAQMFPVAPGETVEFDVSCQFPLRLAVPLTPVLPVLPVLTLPPHPNGAQKRTTRSTKTRTFISSPFECETPIQRAESS